MVIRIGTVDVILLDLPVQSVSPDAQGFGGLGDVVSAGKEGLPDIVSLGCLKGGAL